MSLPRKTESLIRQLLDILPMDGIENPEALVRRLTQLQRGLDPEHEFALILSWLGRCRLVHRLGQEQLPLDSTATFRVPDLLAVFEYENQLVPALIEVKTTDVADPMSLEMGSLPYKKNKYAAYADVVGLHLLIAWRHRGIWSLFDASHGRLANVNHKIDFATALKENLLGLLAGDFSYRLTPGTRIRMRFRKLADPDPATGEFPATITNVDYVNPSGKVVTDVPQLHSLFMFWQNDVEIEEDGDDIVQSFVIPDGTTAELASRTLARLVHSFSSLRSESVDWHAIVHDSGHFAHQAGELKHLIAVAARHGMASNIWTVIPHTFPSFLPKHLSDE